MASTPYRSGFFFALALSLPFLRRLKGLQEGISDVMDVAVDDVTVDEREGGKSCLGERVDVWVETVSEDDEANQGC